MCRWLPALATAFSRFTQSVDGPEFEVASLKKVKGIPNSFEDFMADLARQLPAFLIGLPPVGFNSEAFSKAKAPSHSISGVSISRQSSGVFGRFCKLIGAIC